MRALQVHSLDSEMERGGVVVGRVQNVSQGGLCVMSPHPMRPSSLVRCDIGLSESPITIPTLMEVRWTQKQKLQAESYLSGLQFLL